MEEVSGHWLQDGRGHLPDASLPNGDGETPLWCAIESSQWTKEFKKEVSRTIQLLRWRGANLNQPNRFGETPLTFAVESGRIEIVKILLRLKVDFKVRDRLGRTPLMVAVEPILDVRVHDSNSGFAAVSGGPPPTKAEIMESYRLLRENEPPAARKERARLNAVRARITQLLLAAGAKS